MRVPAPNLRQKLEPLRGTHVKDELIANLLAHQSKPGVTLDPAALSRSLSLESFPEDYVGSLLRLFSLRPPQELHRCNPQHAGWFDLLAEPDFPAFVARVRLLDGEVPTAPPAGSQWRQFLDERREHADALGRECIQVNRLDKPRPVLAGAMRAVPEGSWAADLSRRTPGLVLDAGERISWTLVVGNLIKPGASGETHLFVFYDVALDGQRMYVPLLPAPAAGSIEMPSTATLDPFVTIPLNPSRQNCLRVDNGWDERALTVVATADPLEESILEDAQLDGPILAERLDLLSVRLRQRERRAAGSCEVMRLSYRVNQFQQRQMA